MNQNARWNTEKKSSIFVWGAWRCTSTPSMASRLARLKYHRNIVVSFTEERKKQKPSSIISHTTIRCSSWTVVQYSTRHYSELTRVYSKKVTSCIIGKCWPNSVLIKKCAPFATVFFILFRLRDRKRKKGRQNARNKGKGKWRNRREIPSSRRLCFNASHERKCFNESDHKDTFVFQHPTTTSASLKFSVQMIPLQRSRVNVKFTL